MILITACRHRAVSSRNLNFFCSFDVICSRSLLFAGRHSFRRDMDQELFLWRCAVFLFSFAFTSQEVHVLSRTASRPKTDLRVAAVVFILGCTESGDTIKMPASFFGYGESCQRCGQL